MLRDITILHCSKDACLHLLGRPADRGSASRELNSSNAAEDFVNIANIRGEPIERFEDVHLVLDFDIDTWCP